MVTLDISVSFKPKLTILVLLKKNTIQKPTLKTILNIVYLKKKTIIRSSIEFLQTQNIFIETMKSNSHLAFHAVK